MIIALHTALLLQYPLFSIGGNWQVFAHHSSFAAAKQYIQQKGEFPLYGAYRLERQGSPLSYDKVKSNIH